MIPVWCMLLFLEQSQTFTFSATDCNEQCDWDKWTLAVVKAIKCWSVPRFLMRNTLAGIASKYCPVDTYPFILKGFFKICRSAKILWSTVLISMNLTLGWRKGNLPHWSISRKPRIYYDWENVHTETYSKYLDHLAMFPFMQKI